MSARRKTSDRSESGSVRKSLELTVFFSYSHADKPLARIFAKRLEHLGIRVWIDEGELRAGDSIVERITAAIAKVQFVVALVSKNSIRSKWCQKELALAVTEGLRRGQVRVLPLRVDEVEMPLAIRDIFYLEVDSKRPLAVVERLLADARSHLEQLHVAALKEAPAASCALSAISRLDPRRLRRLRSAIRSREDYIPGSAMEALVHDGSVPAAEILYQDALDDALTDRNAGFGAGGLAELGATAAPWLYRMLTHEDNRVIFEAFYALASVGSMMTDEMRKHMFDTIDALIAAGDWTICERRLREAVKGDKHDLNRLEEMLAYARDEISET